MAKKVARKAVAARAKKTPAKSARKKSAGKAPARKAATRKAAVRVSLGRPKVTGDEKLYMLFRDDYHARQIFEFLRVQTVRELEQYTPQQIVDRLSAPLVETVQRIRRTLAELNRHLAEDAPFAQDHKRRAAERPKPTP